MVIELPSKPFKLIVNLDPLSFYDMKCLQVGIFEYPTKAEEPHTFFQSASAPLTPAFYILWMSPQNCLKDNHMRGGRR